MALFSRVLRELVSVQLFCERVGNAVKSSQAPALPLLFVTSFGFRRA